MLPFTKKALAEKKTLDGEPNSYRGGQQIQIMSALVV